MKYIELTIELKQTEPWREILIARLGEEGFESFVETKTGFLGYIPEKTFSPAMLDPILSSEQVDSYGLQVIEDRNWNAEWEKNFDPVYVDRKLAILAPFHDVPEGFEQIVTIMPRMSFGTGHHQTTWLMSKRLFDLDLRDRDVLDMGTGTGILAILAEKLGARSVFATDIDQWSYENALENCQANQCSRIEVALGDDRLIGKKIFHIVLANINRNVLVQHFSVYSASLVPGGVLLISGFFETDKDDLVREAEKYGLTFDTILTKEGWALIEFKKD